MFGCYCSKRLINVFLVTKSYPLVLTNTFKPCVKFGLTLRPYLPKGFIHVAKDQSTSRLCISQSDLCLKKPPPVWQQTDSVGKKYFSSWLTKSKAFVRIFQFEANRKQMTHFGLIRLPKVMQLNYKLSFSYLHGGLTLR